MMYDFQKALLSLYTNEVFLSSFKKNPLGALARFDLTDHERETLIHLPLPKVESFHRDLVHKRISVAKQVLKRGNMVTLMAFWKNSPALVWGAEHSPRIVAVSDGVARLARKISGAHEHLTLGSVFRARTSLSDKVPLVDVVTLVRLMTIYRLVGKRVFTG